VDVILQKVVVVNYYWIARPKEQREPLTYLVQLWMETLRQALGKFVEKAGIMGE
jgi:hypothetical protein